jgi:ubiquitin-like 1-activating enzyme E1 B
MAGNIIPAIATTNAIIAGIIVLQTVHLLRQSYEQLSLTFLQTKHNRPLNGSRPMAPNLNCAICRDIYTTVHCDPARTTLRDIVEGILGPGEGHGTGPRDVYVYEAVRLLADPDFDKNFDRTLADLSCGRGKFVTIVDEDGEYGTINVAICLLRCVSRS